MSFMCSDIEPDTSIRQNMTAWATGFGTVSKRRYRMSIGSMNGIRRIFAFNASISAISSMRCASSQPGSSASSSSIVSRRGRRNATRRAGPVKPFAFRFSKLALGEVRQFEIVEEQVDKFVTAQNEPEITLAVAFTRPGRFSAAYARTREHVAFDEFLVSGKHHVARAAFAAKARFIHPVERDADFAAFQDIPDVAVL